MNENKQTKISVELKPVSKQSIHQANSFLAKILVKDLVKASLANNPEVTCAHKDSNCPTQAD